MMSTVNGNDPLDVSDTETKFENELTSSISSEIDVPGTVPTLTSSGRLSPLRVRPLRDQETQLQELKKENFGLKLRIYHLEDRLRQRHGDLNEDWEMNIQLNVQVDEMKQEMANRDLLLRDAKNAIDSLEKKIKVLEDQLEESRHPSEELSYLQDALRKAELEIEENRLKAIEAEKAALAENQRALLLEEENRNLVRQLEEMGSRKPAVNQRSREVQTEENTSHKIKLLEDELLESKQENKKLKESCDVKDKKIQELELELLKVTNRMAAMATDHAQQKQTLTDEINELKTYLQQKDEQLRAKDLEIHELNKQLRELHRQLRESTDLIDQLRTRLANKDEECREKDREIEGLRRRLHDLQNEVERLTSIVKGLEKTIRERDEEIEELKRRLRQKERELSDALDELSSLKNQLAEKERALATARTSAHSTNMDSQEKSSQVTQLLSEIQHLQVENRQEVKLKTDALYSAEAKDEIIAQLKRDIENLHCRIVETENRILQITTAHAAEKGALQATIEQLTRDIEQREETLCSMSEELSHLRGENEALKREIERLRAENADIVAAIEDMEQQIREKDLLLDQAEHTIASLQKALEELSQTNGKHDGVPTAEVARLRALLEAQEQVLKTKDGEIASIRQALTTKDKIIADLQAELQKAYHEKQTLEEALLILNSEREQLEVRVRELEEAAYNNDDSYAQARRAVEALQEQVRRLEEQLLELGRSPRHVSVSVESTPKKDQTSSPGSTSTTMIIGGVSENLLLTILQRVEELYREVTYGRTEGSHSSSHLSEKMDELSKLQKHVRSLLRKGNDNPLELQEALLKELELLRAELEAYKAREMEGVDNVEDFSSTIDELQRGNEHLIHELELEKERSKLDGVKMEQKACLLEQELKSTRKRLRELERDLLEMNTLQRELERSRAECASLRGRLEAAEDHARRLRAEITELRLSNLHHSNEMVASSLPDLYGVPPPEGDQWGATASSFTLGGDHLDLSELIEKHREVTRLNQKLQRKCEEKLLGSPSSSARTTSNSGNSSFWQARLKQQEQMLRNEMADKDKQSHFRLQQLEKQLRDNEHRREILQNQLAEAMATTNSKEHEIISIKTSLHGAQDKVERLETKLAQVLVEKNSKIKDLEDRVSELLSTRSMYTPTADGELKLLRKSNLSLREEKAVLLKQLKHCQDQVLALTKELEVYQQLLDDPTRGLLTEEPTGEGASGKVHKLLEEIRQLRRQLEQSIHNNVTLSDHLTHKLTTTSFDSADGSPTTSNGQRRHNVTIEDTHISSTGATPFLPHATSTVNSRRSRSKAGVDMHTMGTSLEEKIVELLNSSSEGIDRGFLQELLVYLQQQRCQLDDSQLLLDRLEQIQDTAIPTVSHISVTTQYGGLGEGEEGEEGRASSRASSVDLSLIHEQLRRTQKALLDSKKLLTKKTKPPP